VIKKTQFRVRNRCELTFGTVGRIKVASLMSILKARVHFEKLKRFCINNYNFNQTGWFKSVSKLNSAPLLIIITLLYLNSISYLRIIYQLQ
jgi:hypothetical protein